MVSTLPAPIGDGVAAAKIATGFATVTCALLMAGVAQGPRAGETGPALQLKPGQEVTFPVAIVDGRVTPGAARVSRPGATRPQIGEITVSVVKHGLSPYAELAASEKTTEPVDFVATGLIGDIKIDEVVICGRLDGSVSIRIAAGSWRVSLNRFFVRQNSPATTGEGGLGCPK